MTGYTCRAHVGTVIKTREPLLCPRWIPSFAVCCSECGTPRERWADPFDILARTRGGDVEKTARRMGEQTAKIAAVRDRQRAKARRRKPVKPAVIS